MANRLQDSKPFLTDIRFSKASKATDLFVKTSSKEIITLSKTGFLPTIKNTRQDGNEVCHSLYQKALRGPGDENAKTSRLAHIKNIEAQLSQTLFDSGIKNADEFIERQLSQGGGRADNFLHATATKNKVIHQMRADEEAHLVELKNKYNKIRFELMKAEQLCVALNKQLAALAPRREVVAGVAAERWKDTVAQNSRVQFEIDIFGNMRSGYKADLDIVRKKHNLLKRRCNEVTKIKAKNITVLEREEELLNTLVPRPGGCPPTAAKPHDENLLCEVKNYMEAFETQRIVEIEEEALNTLRLKLLQTSQHHIRDDLNACIREQQALSHNIERCKKKNDELKHFLSLITQKLHVSRDGELVQRLRYVFDQRGRSPLSSSMAQNPLRDSVCFKAKIIVDTFKTQTSYTEAHEESSRKSASVDLRQRESVHRRKIRENSAHKKEKELNDEFLKACAVLSRVCFQLFAANTAFSSVNESNLLSAMTAAGLRLQKLVFLCQAECDDAPIRSAQTRTSAISPQTSPELEGKKQGGERDESRT